MGIDASNIRGGGGLTHLVELLAAASPNNFGFSKVIVWGGAQALSKIEPRAWLEKKIVSELDRSLYYRAFWQKFKLSKLAKESGCSLLFLPGGSFSGRFRPFVTMSQNLLPFEIKEIKRYAFTKNSLRLVLLRFIQSSTFQRAQGIIFLTEFARRRVLEQFSIPLEKTTIINHGINPIFYKSPRPQKEFKEFTNENPAKILYVSFIGEYKHQWNVVKAIGLLKQKNYPITITFVGSADEKEAFRKFSQSVREIDLENQFIKYYNNVTYQEVEQKYTEADIFLFASSCETFGQIVTEAMASSLPIACSKLSAMSELLGDSAVFFDPEDSKDISTAIEKLLLDHELRFRYACQVHEKAKNYSWIKCADQSFSFLHSIVARDHLGV